MRVSLFTALCAAAFAPGAALAAAGPNLATSWSTPAAVVDASATYGVSVKNNGNQNANSVSLSIALPPTSTSPTVYVLGDLGTTSASCSRSGTTLTCSLGTIKRGKTTSVSFAFTAPYSADSLDFTATASTSGETNPADNTASTSANLSYYANTVATGVSIDVDHCTGTNLSAFYECELFPSSISTHQMVFESDSSVSIPGYPDYSGSWSHPGGDSSRLVFQYTELGTPVADFEGRGVSGGCYEGLTTFPSSSWVSPYQFCF
jgi:uncharacterized repeat protein (TIGR01451 family)